MALIENWSVGHNTNTRDLFVTHAKRNIYILKLYLVIMVISDFIKFIQYPYSVLSCGFLSFLLHLQIYSHSPSSLFVLFF